MFGRNTTEVQLAFRKQVDEGTIALNGTVQAIMVKPVFTVKDVPTDYDVEVLPERQGETCGDAYVVTHKEFGYTKQGFDLKWVYDKVRAAVSLGRTHQ